jgi:hypothetical protein
LPRAYLVKGLTEVERLGCLVGPAAVHDGGEDAVLGIWQTSEEIKYISI